MTIPSNDRRKEYSGNGVATAFNAPKVASTSELDVYLFTIATLTNELQVEGEDEDYEVSILRTSSRVTFHVPPPAGKTVVILRTVPVQQDVDLTNQGSYLPEVVEGGLDTIAKQLAMLNDRQSRCIRVPDTYPGMTGASFALGYPPATTSLVGWDSSLGQMVFMNPDDLTPTDPGGSSAVQLLRNDLSSSNSLKGTRLLSHRGTLLQTLLDDLTDQAEFGLGAAGSNTARSVGQGIDFLTLKGTDSRGETYVNGLRRSIKLLRAVGSQVEESPEISDDADESYSGRLNSTAAGFYLLALTTYARVLPNRSGQVRTHLQEAADWLLTLQWNQAGTARFGGMKLAPDNGNTSCFGTAVCGRALLQAYEITRNARYLTAARQCADYLLVLKEPNATYQAIYAETPIPAYTANGRTFNGFCDGISAADTITLTSLGWNTYACIFLKEIGDLLANATYQAASAAALTFYTPIAQYAFDFFAVQNAAPPAHASTRFTNDGTLNFADHDWHRMGEYTISGAAVNSGTLAGATSTTVTLPGSASATDGAYNNMIIRLTAGVGADGDTNERRKIVSYNGTTKVATFDRAYTITPNSSTTYSIGLYPNTMGTDQWEYCMEALYACGYNPAQLLTWYTAWTSLPNATLDSFGAAYEGGRSLTGYIRVASPVYGGDSKAYGSYYDSVGAAILLKFKKDMAPDDYAKARNMCLVMPQRGALLDENMNTIYGTVINGIERATKGTLPVAEAVIALLETLDI